jgi:hypothetical protein
MEERNPLELKAFPFVIAGFFVSDRSPDEVLNIEVDEEKLMELEKLIKETFFKDKNLDIRIFPYIVPPDKTEDALNDLANIIFSTDEVDEEGI